MSHPHNEHRDHKVQHRRVHHITGGMAKGGFAHSGEQTDMKPIRKKVKVQHRMHGGRVAHRADRPARAKGGFVGRGSHTRDDLQPYEGAPDDRRHRAKGGRTKHKGKTTINIINAHPQGGAGLGSPPAVAAPPVPPRPMPMAAPPAAAPPAMVPGMPPRPIAPPGAPPMMGPRRSGGRAFARGGGVKDGPAYQEGARARPVEHAPGKQDTADVGRGKPVTYKKGGRVLVSFYAGGRVAKRAHGGRIEAPKGNTGRGDFAQEGSTAKPPRAPKMHGGNEPPTKVPHSRGNESKQGLAQKYGGGLESTHSYAGAHIPGGSKGGLARLYKAHRYAKMG